MANVNIKDLQKTTKPATEVAAKVQGGGPKLQESCCDGRILYSTAGMTLRLGR